MSMKLNAEVRSGKSRSHVRGLRSEGRVPASVYGKKISVGESISVSEKELTAILKKNPNAVIQLTIADKGNHPVMINEIQRDKLVGKLLHVDFHQISMDEPVRSNITVELTGTPAGVKEGGILTVDTHEVEVRCLPKDLPSSFSIDISELGIGDNVLISSLTIPDQVELLSEPTDVIASVLAPRKAEEETVEEAADEAAEPAVIGEEEETE